MKMSLFSISATAFLAIAAASLAGAPSRAEIDYPWCSNSPTSGGGGPVCRFTSLEQCQASVFGLNGYCTENARIVWQRQQQGPKRGAR
jgi:hypothetical protein